MEIDLRRVEEGAEPIALDGRGDPLVLDADAGVALSGWRFEGWISSVAGDRRIRGSLTGRLPAVCDRCLAPIDREVQADLDVRIVVADGKVPAARESEGVVYVASDASVVDLEDPLRAAALLEVPIQNLCREDCRGICPSCGTNRNEELCDCKRTSTDPRWDALKSVFDSTAGQEPKE